MTDINAVLSAREVNYGKFEDHATLSQSLKDSVRSHPNWNALDPDMKEAVEMILHKTARIVNGKPRYKDSWVDIKGYAQLVEDRLEEGEKYLAEIAECGVVPSNAKLTRRVK